MTEFAQRLGDSIPKLRRYARALTGYIDTAEIFGAGDCRTFPGSAATWRGSSSTVSKGNSVVKKLMATLAFAVGVSTAALAHHSPVPPVSQAVLTAPAVTLVTVTTAIPSPRG